MPCFKGIAVSVHAEAAPLPEYSVQKQSRVSRVNTYIPVPPARIPKDSSTNKPEPSKFAISITLLTPGLPVPYSTPKPTLDNPDPHAQIVAGLPGTSSDRSGQSGVIGPYIPITKSENETIAAYIYFDGRAKEEVATLLRPGEETWVNSRWVQVSDSEGGGLAEREFLFREVGLERWLNGLDLDGHDAAAKIERRRQKFDRRRRRRKQDGEINGEAGGLHKSGLRDVLRYGADERTPVEKLSDDDMSSGLDSDDDDDAPPEAAGQIKVAMFRVLASGEIKRGEYSPQFDAHDDDESSEGAKDSNGGAEEADIDHTTSFAKPKTLDPKSISTQTVSGIDGPDKPYAVFTFFYRGERQLQKMGILDSSKQSKPSAASAKHRSAQLDFSNLPPLKPGGTVGFSAFRENDLKSRKTKSRKRSNEHADNAMAEDSEEDDDDMEILRKMDEAEDKDVKPLLSPEDAKHQGELAEGVGRIKLKRQHSAEPLNPRKSPGSVGTPTSGMTPPDNSPFIATPNLNTTNAMFKSEFPDDAGILGSPMKKQRGSIYDKDDEEALKNMLNKGVFAPPMGNVLSLAEAAQSTASATPLPSIKTEVDDEI